MKTNYVYVVSTSNHGSGSETRFSSYSEAARFVKYLLDTDDRSAGRISISKVKK